MPTSLHRTFSWTALLLFTLTASGFAKAGKIMSPFPSARMYPQPVGILFPGFNVAPGVNAAALPTSGKGTAAQAAYGPPIRSGDPMQFFGSLSTASKDLGIGFGYMGSKASGQNVVSGAFGGFGYVFDSISLGLGVRDLNLADGFRPDVDIGFIMGTKGELTFGVVAYHINENAQICVGVGTGGKKKFNIEANVTLPPLHTNYQPYILTVSASLTPGIVGVHFRSSYYTRIETFTHTIAGGVWLGEQVLLTAQYSTDREVLGSATVMF